MDEEAVKRYIGKIIIITLKNNFQYTCLMPCFEGSSFSIVDKFGKHIDIECEYIAFIREI